MAAGDTKFLFSSGKNDWNIFQHWKRNFLSLLGHVIPSMYVPQNNNYLGIAFPGMSILNGDLARHVPFLKKKYLQSCLLFKPLFS